MARWASLVVAWLAAAIPVGAAAQGRVVLLPFENASRRGAALEIVMPAVEAALRGKGWDVVSGPAVEEFLRSRRIRYLDSLAATHVRELASAHAADALVAGSILAYDADARDPFVAIVARVVAKDGVVVWTDLASLSVETTGGAFDRGKVRKIEDVARRTVTELLARTPGPTPLSTTEPSRTKAETFVDAPRVFRSRDLLGQRLTICVLPLQNFTPSRDAPRVLDAVLHQRLSSRLDTTSVSPAELRAAIVQRKLRAPSVLSIEQLRDLSGALGTSLFLRGTVLAYGGPAQFGAAAPIELYLTLIDARSGEIMWSGLHRRAGADYEGLLRFGAIRDDPTLASRVVAELLDAFTRRVSTMEAE